MVILLVIDVKVQSVSVNLKQAVIQYRLLSNAGFRVQMRHLPPTLWHNPQQVLTSRSNLADTSP